MNALREAAPEPIPLARAALLFPVLGMALIVRAVFVLSLGERYYFGDAIEFQRAASAHFHGSLPGGLAGEPLLPALTAIARVVGGGRDLLVARALMLAFGLLTVALCGWIGREMAGPRAGRIAAVIAAFSPSLVFASGLLHPAALSTCLFATALLAVWKLVERPSPRWVVTLAAMTALASLVDRSLLVPIALASSVPFVSWARRGRRVAALAGLTSIVAVLVLELTPARVSLAPLPDPDSSYGASNLLEGIVRFIVPLHPEAPGEMPLTGPGMVLAALLYFAPLFVLTQVGLFGRGRPAAARTVLALSITGFLVLFAFDGGHAYYRVAATPCMIVAATLALERWWSSRRVSALLGAAAGRPSPGPVGRLGLASFYVGLVLLSVTVAGRFVPMRNPEILANPPVWEPRRPHLSERDVYAAIRSSTTDRAAYLERLNHAVTGDIVHYWGERDADRYAMRIPFHENYVLNLASWVDPARFRRFEFVDYRSALARGVGLCSQYALAECGVLESRGIPTGIVDLHGHVVTLARVDDRANRWWVLDPDYGVIVPHDIGEVETHPEIVRPYYLAAGLPTDSVNHLVDVYAVEGNRRFSGTFGYAHLRHFLAERVSYFLIWLIPLLLMAPHIRALVGPWAGNRVTDKRSVQNRIVLLR